MTSEATGDVQPAMRKARCVHYVARRELFLTGRDSHLQALRIVTEIVLRYVSGPDLLTNVTA
jgi:hypothetical protein